uniref:Uncharacterized protein n=1 Tax=Kalanchoe fedtschenkoi TaxID=63787 RepID=A0A7N0U0K2_KALFE
MKHSKKAKKIQHPGYSKFSSLLACCFGGGQPSAKKLASDHNKSRRHHHRHRWLLSPYWSHHIRLKESAASGSKTLPLDLFGASSPMTMTPPKSKSFAAGGAALEPDIIHVVDKAGSIISKESSSLKSSSNHHQFAGLPLQEEARRSNSTCPNKIQALKRLDNSCLPSRSKSERLSKLDPLVGLSMVMITLLVMVIWGRVCAILSMSAWFYFVSLCNSHAPNEILNSKLDVQRVSTGSATMKECKKRIVLDGFLERDNRKQLQLNIWNRNE